MIAEIRGNHNSRYLPGFAHMSSFSAASHSMATASEAYLSRALRELSEDHKEILYFLAVRGYSTKATAALRGQTDRNIRKVRNTLLKKITKKILPVLKRREEKGLPLTREERALLAEMNK